MAAPRTVLDLYRTERSSPREEHYVHVTPSGRRSLSTDVFASRTAALAAGLARLGVCRGDRVVLVSDNRPEWHMVDLAVAALGAADVPLYGTLTPAQVAYQVKDSGAVAAVAENREQMAKLLAVLDDCPDLTHLVQIDEATEPGVLALAEVVDSGASADAEDLFWQRAEEVGADDLLTLIYTSGTTGNPKGVALTHHNMVANVVASATRATVDPDDFALEFLPLCHSFERMVGYLLMHVAVRKAYCSVYHVGELLATIGPTVFAGVPRFYEKVHQRILDTVARAAPHRRALFRWALGVGRRVTPLTLRGERPTGVLGVEHRLADRLVLAKVRQGLGGRVRFAISGGAPLPMFVNEFFHAIGVRLLEGYGLTETSPVVAVNGAEPDACRLGTVGRPIPGVEVKVSADGELLVRGPSVMQGYWNLPEQTAEVFDEDGFFRTGDVASIDEGGFVRITDRKKDLIVTAGGKNVAPQPVENRLKESPLVDNAVLVGDRRPYVVALLSPNREELERWARQRGVRFDSFAELTRSPRVAALFDEVVESVNGSLARYEQIKRHAVLPVVLTTETGHLTPTLKVKRRVVEQEFTDLIDELYR